MGWGCGRWREVAGLRLVVGWWLIGAEGVGGTREGGVSLLQYGEDF